MKRFLAYYRSIAAVSAGLAILAGIALFAYTQNASYPAGLAIGTGAGLLKLRLDVVAILQWHEQARTGGTAGTPQLRSYFHALLLLAVALAPGLLAPASISVWAGLGGYLLPRAVLIGDGVIRPAALGAAAASEETPALAEDGEGRTAHGA